MLKNLDTFHCAAVELSMIQAVPNLNTTQIEITRIRLARIHPVEYKNTVMSCVLYSTFVTQSL